MLIHGEALYHFNLLYTDVENTDTLSVDYYIKGLESYFPLLIRFFLKRAIRCYIKKTVQSKLRRYGARLIDLNEYLDSFSGATIADKIGVTEFNENFKIVCRTAGLNKPMLKALIASLVCLKKPQTCLSIWKLQKLFMKVW